MLGASAGAVNETDASATRRAAACATTRPARSTTARSAQTSCQGRVAQRHQDGVAGLTTFRDPCAETRPPRASPTSTRWMNDSSARRAARRATSGSSAAARVGRDAARPESPNQRDVAGVGHQQPRRAQKQRGLSRSARTHDARPILASAHREIDVGERVRARHARPAPRDESLGDAARPRARIRHADRYAREISPTRHRAFASAIMASQFRGYAVHRSTGLRALSPTRRSRRT